MTTTIDEICSNFAPFLSHNSKIDHIWNVTYNGERYEVFTNGRFLLARPSDRAHETTGHEPNIEEFIRLPSGTPTHRFRHQEGLPDWHMRSCEECKGTRLVTCMCYECDNEHERDCDCDDGLAPAKCLQSFVLVGDAAVDAIYIKMFLDLVDSAKILIVASADRLAPIGVRAGEWVGVIMPVRHYSEDEPLWKAEPL
jgi:hypothetical protein